MNKSIKAFMLGGVAAMSIMIAQPVYAQDTSSSVRGVITTPDGTPIAGQTVIIRDTRTGTTKTVTTTSSGAYSARGLRVGGPYTVRVISSDYLSETVEGIVLTLGQTQQISVQLDDRSGSVEEVIVFASQLNTGSTAIGPSSTFNLTDLENAPAINRDIKDVIRSDPRIYLDESGNRGDAIQCAGANPRFNSLTVDGVGLNDNFGLNSNGYPTERMPFSFDAIQQVAVELAPFDVEYGSFTACNINAVTKSGSNEFHGGAFIDYTSDGMRGKSLEGDTFTVGDYTEKRYGLTFGGPIIEDKLFFFAAYEKLDGAQLFDRGPAGSGRAREVEGVSQAQLDEIVSIAKDIYGYDPGTLPASLPISDEKLLVKIDWNINDDHRLAFTYNYNDGFTIAESDGDDDELELSNHYYERGAKLKSYSGQIFSDWSDQFSTDVRISYTDLDNRQLSLGGTEFGEVQIRTFNDHDGDGNRSRATVYLGSDDSRQANKLAYTTWNMKLAGHYQLNDHLITAGFESVSFDVFNLFIQEAEGEVRFRAINRGGLDMTSIEAFRAGRPERFIYENAAPSNNKDDAAATFKYNINTVYLQDEFTLENLEITAGVRYDWYTSDDLPTANPHFFDRNGFTNASNFDGRGLFLPRLGFTWDNGENVSVHGGAGLYSGGNPNVWLSNNYSNNGVTQVQITARDYDDGVDSPTLFTDPTVDGGDPIFAIPQRLFDGVASGSANSGTNAIDPDFKIPTQLKIALGTNVQFGASSAGDDFNFSADILYSKMRNSAKIRDSSIVEIGTAPDGRPMYASVNKADPDCVDPLSSDCGRRWFNSDYILTNAKGGEQLVLSTSISRAMSNGIDWSLAYAYTRAKDVNPMTSAVAFSNFASVATSNRNNPLAATSNYEIPHRFTGKLSITSEIWGDNITRVSMFGTVNQGRPYSFTFVDGGGSFNSAFTEFGDGIDGGHLLYIPTGVDDPLVNFGDDFNTSAFFAYLAANDLTQYAGGIAPRNSNSSDWWAKVDLRIDQEIPIAPGGVKVSAFFVIENFTNLINDSWGVMHQASFPRMFRVVDATINRVDNVYNYNEFFERSQGRVTTPSLWEMRAGIRVTF
jgi:hypothetical protein